jgi:cell division protein FtsL
VIVRILNLVVIGALIMAAAYVYRIKYDSTVQAERLAKIRSEVRRERDAIAALRAEWGELETPSRVEALAKRYLHLKPIVPTQFDKLDALPEQPPQLVKPDSRDPIGDVIENLEETPAAMTGSLWPPAAAPQATPAAAPVAPIQPVSAAPAVPVPATPAVPVLAAPAQSVPVSPAASAPPAPVAGAAPASTSETNVRTPTTKSGRLDR